MKVKYNEEAIAKCRDYFIEFAGAADEIEKKMRRDYPSWSRQNLFDKGKGKNARLGWINRFGFEKSLKIAQMHKIGAIENDDERSYRILCELGVLYEEKALQGDEKAVPILLKINDQKIEFRSKLDLSASNFESFVESFEDISKWALEINKDLAKLFYKHKDGFIERASRKYGKNANESGN